MDPVKRRHLIVGIFPNVLYTIYLYLLIGAIANLFNGISFTCQISIALFIGIFTVVPIPLEIRKSHIITRLMMKIAELMKWTFLMGGILTIAIYILEMFISIPSEIIFSIYIVILSIITIYAYIKAHKIKIKTFNLKIANLNSDVNLIHISDLHIGSMQNKGLLENIVLKINSIDADAVIISGDLADGTCPIDDSSFLPFKKSKVPVIFTPGNHDYYPGIENVLNAAKASNIRVLSNDILNLKGLQIIGIPFSFKESTTYGSNKNDLNNIDYNPNKPTVLINHIPLNWDNFSTLGVDLLLSGHTHGGQFYPMNWLLKLVFPFSNGIYENNGKYLCVTTGIGTYGPPMRWGTDSEMVLLKLANK
ncbi:metallophosphoesterase [Methanobrevibacter sp. DSM 116169]|uniref:metallophosphoesterase n=1 Tax=Methanobrevibacter sp. DSM 116169 TaxID=3242727 RepID=UPI0038FD0B0D